MIGKCLGCIGLLDLDGASQVGHDTKTEITPTLEKVSLENRIQVIRIGIKWCLFLLLLQFSANFIIDLFAQIDACEHSQTIATIHACAIRVLNQILDEQQSAEVWKKLPQKIMAKLVWIQKQSKTTANKNDEYENKIDVFFNNIVPK